MTHKQIEAAREIRLWVGQIIVPASIGVMSLLTIPEVRSAVAAKAESIKKSIQKKDDHKIIHINQFKKKGL